MFRTDVLRVLVSTFALLTSLTVVVVAAELPEPMRTIARKRDRIEAGLDPSLVLRNRIEPLSGEGGHGEDAGEVTCYLGKDGSPEPAILKVRHLFQAAMLSGSAELYFERGKLLYFREQIEDFAQEKKALRELFLVGARVVYGLDTGGKLNRKALDREGARLRAYTKSLLPHCAPPKPEEPPIPPPPSLPPPSDGGATDAATPSDARDRDL